MGTSIKGYVNDFAGMARTVGGRVSVSGSIHPVGVFEKGSDGDLEAEIERQVAAGAGRAVS